ncbi:hypothetical protein [Deinococcus alpinitundrae]|uniref:hypothetical protein n=1 Tax=Deinococcus alpinitundrae TaxID=468913 RepID=UPI001ED98148|nr:hypothetical protein [Deinococcus alpinitundrae]
MPLTKVLVIRMSGNRMSGADMMDPWMPEERMPGIIGAPILKYTSVPNMNMMVYGHAVGFGKVPSYKLSDYTYTTCGATLRYQKARRRGLFDLYNKTLM